MSIHRVLVIERDQAGMRAQPLFVNVNRPSKLPTYARLTVAIKYLLVFNVAEEQRELGLAYSYMHSRYSAHDRTPHPPKQLHATTQSP